MRSCWASCWRCLDWAHGFGRTPKHHFNTLPYFTEDGTTEAFGESVQRVQPFTLTNHLSEPFDSQSLDGKVWLAAFLRPMRRTWRK